MIIVMPYWSNGARHFPPKKKIQVRFLSGAQYKEKSMDNEIKGKSIWRVSKSKKETILILSKDGIKSRLKYFTLRSFEEVDYHLTHHWLCGTGMPEFLWRVPVGKPRYDRKDVDETGAPWLENSLPKFLMDFHNKFWDWADKGADEEIILSIPITDEQYYTLAPDMKELWEEIKNEK